jgi:hypothetical protein
MKEKREEKVRSGGLALRLELAGGGGRALVTRPTKGPRPPQQVKN